MRHTGQLYRLESFDTRAAKGKSSKGTMLKEERCGCFESEGRPSENARCHQEEEELVVASSS